MHLEAKTLHEVAKQKANALKLPCPQGRDLLRVELHIIPQEHGSLAEHAGPVRDGRSVTATLPRSILRPLYMTARRERVWQPARMRREYSRQPGIVLADGTVAAQEDDEQRCYCLAGASSHKFSIAAFARAGLGPTGSLEVGARGDGEKGRTSVRAGR